MFLASFLRFRDRPFELCTDGDFLTLGGDLLKRGREIVQITKVKCHAVDDMVRTGRFRALEKFSDDLADRAADVGRRRLPPQVIDPRRQNLAAIWEWSPIVYDFQRKFIAPARDVVIDDGTRWVGPSPDCLGQWWQA